MAERRSTALLQDEHRSIQKVVAAMVVLADRLETGREVKAGALQDVVEFMTTLVAAGHERKEELFLFPVLERRGISVHSVPARALVEEHRRGKALVAMLEEAASAHARGNPDSRQSLVESLRGLAGLYPLHIWQEDLLLFHLADSRLSVGDDEQLLEAFRQADEAVGGPLRGRLQEAATRIQRESW